VDVDASTAVAASGSLALVGLEQSIVGNTLRVFVVMVIS